MSDRYGELEQLPPNWKLMIFSESVDNISTVGKKIKQRDYLPDGKFPIIDQGIELIGGYTDDESCVVECELPVIVFGDHTKVVKFINQRFAPGADGVKVLKPHNYFDPKLFFYFTQILARQIVDKGYARHYQYLSKSHIPLPPIDEQRRIVAKIEELFSQLDAGVAALEAARAQLKRYRQALLKAAFEGRLTEEWRRAHAGELEDADALLARIRAEREARAQAQLRAWEQAVRAWEAAGRPGKKPRKPRKPKDLPPLTEEERAALPELPGGWAWVRLGNIAGIVGGVTKGRKLDDKKTIKLPYLRVANVQDGYLDLTVVKEIEVLPEDFEKYRLLPGDILYTEGGDKDKLGRGTVWDGQIENCIHQNHIFRARVSKEFFNPKYVALFSQTQVAKQYFFKRGKQTTNLASINLTVLSNLPLPLIPKIEQNQVISVLETHLSSIDYLNQTIEQALARATALRQAILKRAFEGRLVASS